MSSTHQNNPLRVRSTRSRGFTLVELLVVMAIIALLVSILFPALNRARDAANQIKCASNLRQIWIAINAYCAENKGEMPPLSMETTGSNFSTILDKTDPARAWLKGPNPPPLDATSFYEWRGWCVILWKFTRSGAIFKCPATSNENNPNFTYGLNPNFCRELEFSLKADDSPTNYMTQTEGASGVSIPDHGPYVPRCSNPGLQLYSQIAPLKFKINQFKYKEDKILTNEGSVGQVIPFRWQWFMGYYGVAGGTTTTGIGPFQLIIGGVTLTTARMSPMHSKRFMNCLMLDGGVRMIDGIDPFPLNDVGGVYKGYTIKNMASWWRPDVQSEIHP